MPLPITYTKFFAFNIWDIYTAKTVIKACCTINRPIFLQVSAKVYKQLDVEEFVWAVKNYADNLGKQMIIHLDHCQDEQMIRDAIDKGFNAVMYDGSTLPLSENINISRRVSELCLKRDVLLEAEIGRIYGVEDDIETKENSQITVNEVKMFLSSVYIDLLAVPIGTAHGHYGTKFPILRYELIEQIGQLTDIPLVVHGGSDLQDETLSKLFSYFNIRKINISTNIKQAYCKGLLEAIEKNLIAENGFDPIRVNQLALENIARVVIAKWSVIDKKI